MNLKVKWVVSIGVFILSHAWLENGGQEDSTKVAKSIFFIKNHGKEPEQV